MFFCISGTQENLKTRGSFRLIAVFVLDKAYYDARHMPSFASMQCLKTDPDKTARSGFFFQYYAKKVSSFGVDEI